MNRTIIVNLAVIATRAKSYLEIGVGGGATFFSVNCPVKYGVDPKPEYPFGSPIYNDSKCFQTTSDVFFESLKEDEKFDVIFIDGWHTYEQSYKDVQNSLKHLNEGGMIILHDCNPNSELCAQPVERLRDYIVKNNITALGAWTGDVFKTILALRVTEPTLNICVADCDFGVGIITKSKQPIPLYSGIELESVKDVDYTYFLNNKCKFLNLKSVDYINNFMLEKARGNV